MLTLKTLSTVKSTNMALAATALLVAAPAGAIAMPLDAALGGKPASVNTGRPAAIPAAAYKRVRKYFGDYMATCRTDGACDAITFSNTPTSSGQTFSSTLTFKRAAGPGAAWFVTFAGAFEGPVKGTPIDVNIDGMSWSLGAGTGYSDIIGHNYFLPPVNAQIVTQMRAGSAMDVAQTINNGSRQTVTYSLRGLTAAMNWIDSMQGRGDKVFAIGVPATIQDAVPQ